MRLAVIGAGYVGLTLSVCLAKMGHHVTCIEKDSDRRAILGQGNLPFFEPGLTELVTASRHQGTLSLTGDLTSGVGRANLVFITVGTPATETGEPDLSALEEVIESLGRIENGNRVVAIKSTVPVGTTDRVSSLLRTSSGRADVAFNPEFLREGSAIDDFFHPARVVIGSHSRVAIEMLTALYQPLGSPILVTDPRTAEMIKYASNAFLATKVSFINEIAMICEEVAADIATVAAGMGADPRIGPHFLKAGIGFGGSCLPKDLRALTVLARQHAVTPHILDAVLRVNYTQRDRFVEKVEAVLGGLEGKTLTVFGLAFKGGTSDARESPALDIASRLVSRGATVRAYDPAAEDPSASALPTLIYCPDAYEAATGAAAILVLSDWPEFEQLDWQQLKQRVRVAVVIDGRGLAIATPATAAGFSYIGPGTRDLPHDGSTAVPNHAPEFTRGPSR